MQILKCLCAKMFCSQCGTKLIKEASFCHKCAVRLQTSASLHRISDAVKTGISNDNPTAVTSTPSSSTDGRAARSTPKLLAAGSGPPIMTFHQFQRKKRRHQEKPLPVEICEKFDDDGILNSPFGIS